MSRYDYRSFALAKLSAGIAEYYKAGVSALVLVEANAVQPNLFEPDPDESGQRLMQVMDQINRRFGAGQIKYAAVGLKQEWKSRVAYPSQRYTTCWDELPIVQAEKRQRPFSWVVGLPISDL